MYQSHKDKSRELANIALTLSNWYSIFLTFVLAQKHLQKHRRVRVLEHPFAI